MENEVLDVEAEADVAVADEPEISLVQTRAQVEGELRARIRTLERQVDAAGLERKTFLLHLRRLEYRNDLLQARLDDSIGREARQAADALDTIAIAKAPVHRLSAARKDQATIRAASYRVAMQSIGRPATAVEIAQVLGLERQRVYNWLNTTGRKQGVTSITGDRTGCGYDGRPPTFFTWPSTTEEAS